MTDSNFGAGLPPGDYDLHRQLGGRYKAFGFRGGMPEAWNFVTNGEPIKEAHFPTSAIKTAPGKTTMVELDAAKQEPIPVETDASTSLPAGTNSGKEAP